MKLRSKLSIWGAVLVLTTVFVSADTIHIGSYATTGPTFGNDNTPMRFVPGLSTPIPGFTPTSATEDVPPGNVWNSSLTSTSSWVSYGQTGPTTPAAGQPGGHFALNGPYLFATDFTLNGNATSYSFSVLADDTTRVYLDGNPVNLFISFPSGPNHICQIEQPNCKDVLTVITTPQGLSLLTAGTHELDFLVFQFASIDMGVDCVGTINTAGTTTPEPSALLLFGSGLLGLGGTIRRRLKG
jgi:hypothetical protein